jgi:hypothetical protein
LQTQLLLTFTDISSIDETIEEIQDHYEVAFDKIFILQDENNPKDIYCTYNIDTEADNDRMHKTISVHRKKETNTIYTINALNSLIVRLNDGELDKEYSVPWENYQNCILLNVGGELREVPTNLFDIEHTSVKEDGPYDF